MDKAPPPTFTRNRNFAKLHSVQRKNKITQFQKKPKAISNLLSSSASHFHCAFLPSNPVFTLFGIKKKQKFQFFKRNNEAATDHCTIDGAYWHFPCTQSACGIGEFRRPAVISLERNVNDETSDINTLLCCLENDETTLPTKKRYKNQ